MMPNAYANSVVNGCFKDISPTLQFYNTTFESDFMGNSRSVRERTPYEQQQFLDVGCGCGRVAKELLWPSCPKNIRRIVGVDICANMVSYARKHSAHPKIIYEQLDIAGDISNFLQEFRTFDRIYCFNSLNRVKEQATAWKNISSLLKPGGECLLFIQHGTQLRTSGERWLKEKSGAGFRRFVKNLLFCLHHKPQIDLLDKLALMTLMIEEHYLLTPQGY
ncbi:hypothetical protein HPB48_001395 [Haemaphysalis longicornis]|uniref:Methyltransferase type 11 domain-containing protein n=1 Tax=Haemaphysalis longicornis TaxID=44386 RepID=A0A9J6GZB5_HAELO|nr:hypothetical protein HPB48_001395 [Haemaphysalis longicornis]